MSENKILVASDLDGTLLTDNKKIKLYTKLFFRKFTKDGNYFVISTGRSPRTAINFQKNVGIKGPIIMFNGNLIYDTSKENILVQEILWPKEKIKNIYKILKKKNLIDGAFCESKFDLCYYHQEYFHFLDMNYDSFEIKNGDLDKIINHDTYNFVIFNSKNNPTIRKEIVETINSNYDDIVVDFWGSDNAGNIVASLLHKGIDKAYAVNLVRKKLNVKKDNVLTFGDSTNDIEMIEEFKHGYAMKNCFSAVKNHTKKFTKKDNNHNGVAFEVKNILKTKF